MSRVARFAFLGTPEMAVGPLRALVAAGHDITLCVTRPDRRRGRGGAVTPSPVKEAAVESWALPYPTPSMTSPMSGAELAVVVAYGRIIPEGLLNLVPMVNLHFSLLPRWRGAAPVERAILAGDHETGVCLMRVEAGLDTGPVYARRVVPMDDEVDLPTLRRELVEVGSALLVETLARGVAGLPTPAAPARRADDCGEVTNEDLHLHWEEPAVQLHRVVRLGRAWTTFRDHRLGILKSRPGADGGRPGPAGDADRGLGRDWAGDPFPPGGAAREPVAHAGGGLAARYSPDGRRASRKRVNMTAVTVTPIDGWSPDQYHRFRSERREAFDDLLDLCVPVPAGRVVDLGCGTGDLTGGPARARASRPDDRSRLLRSDAGARHRRSQRRARSFLCRRRHRHLAR